MYACVFVSMYGMCVGSWGGQQRVLGPLARVQGDCEPLDTVLETELESTGRAGGVLTSWAVCTGPQNNNSKEKQYMFPHEGEQVTVLMKMYV